MTSQPVELNLPQRSPSPLSKLLLAAGTLSWSFFFAFLLMVLLAVTASVVGPDANFGSMLSPGGSRPAPLAMMGEILHNNLLMLAITAAWALYSVRLDDEFGIYRPLSARLAMSGLLLFILCWHLNDLAPGMASLAQQMGLDPLRAIAYFAHGPFELGAFVLPVVWVWLNHRSGRVLTWRGTLLAIAGAVLLLVAAAGVESTLTPHLMDQLSPWS